jgi:hypothetical protein
MIDLTMRNSCGFKASALTSLSDNDLAQLVLLQVGQHGPTIGAQQLLLLEQIHLTLHGLWADQTLSGIHIKVDVKPSVHLFKLDDGKVSETFPQAECFRIAVFHELEECSRFIVDRWVGFGFGIDFHVDLQTGEGSSVAVRQRIRARTTHIVQVLDSVRLEFLLGPKLFEPKRQQTKLLAPIT